MEDETFYGNETKGMTSRLEVNWLSPFIPLYAVGFAETADVSQAAVEEKAPDTTESAWVSS